MCEGGNQAWEGSRTCLRPWHVKLEIGDVRRKRGEREVEGKSDGGELATAAATCHPKKVGVRGRVRTVRQQQQQQPWSNHEATDEQPHARTVSTASQIARSDAPAGLGRCVR
jgi:hypothetical protein